MSMYVSGTPRRDLGEINTLVALEEDGSFERQVLQCTVLHKLRPALRTPRNQNKTKSLSAWKSNKREKMMCIILLLINLTSCVCGVSKPYDTPLKYQAEENSDIQVEWSFSSETDIPLPSLKIHCQKVLGLKVFYHLDYCIEESQHEQFAGRVQCDKDALRGGRVRLHLSRVKMNDSGVYLCRMATDFGRKVKEFSLDITAAVDKPKPVTPTPAPVSRGRISLCVVLGLAAAAVLVLLAVLAVHHCTLSYIALRNKQDKEQDLGVVFTSL